MKSGVYGWYGHFGKVVDLDLASTVGAHHHLCDSLDQLSLAMVLVEDLEATDIRFIVKAIGQVFVFDSRNNMCYDVVGESDALRCFHGLVSKKLFEEAALAHG